jgi:hypothetical protein
LYASNVYSIENFNLCEFVFSLKNTVSKIVLKGISNKLVNTYLTNCEVTIDHLRIHRAEEINGKAGMKQGCPVRLCNYTRKVSIKYASV